MKEIRLIEVKENIMADNAAAAEKLRARLRAERTFLINVMASPGAGKTSTILKTIEALRDEIRINVIEADIDSLVDSETITAAGTRAVQLHTGGFCHLDAGMVEQGLNALDTDELDLVIIENVGNLVCPAEFDTGAIKNIMILSVPEGDDKPLKYPLMFSVCDVLIVNKMDYIGLSDFDLEALRERVLKLKSDIEIFEISCKTGKGVDGWADWLRQQVKTFAQLQTP